MDTMYTFIATACLLLDTIFYREAMHMKRDRRHFVMCDQGRSIIAMCIMGILSILFWVVPVSAATLQAYSDTSTKTFSTAGGQTTTHSFSVPSGAVAAASATLEVSIRGDFNASTEYADIYINNVFVGKHDGGAQCSSTYSTKNFTISQSDLNKYMASGQILIEVKNSSAVNTCSSSPRDHKVTLKFAYITGTPVTGFQTYSDTSTKTFSTASSQTTTHAFSVPSGAVAAGTATLEVSVRGDYGASTEYSNIYINNVFVGKHDGGGKECSNTYSTKTYTISQSDLAKYLATGQILVEVKNSSAVNFCSSSNRDHKVTLKYDYTTGTVTPGAQQFSDTSTLTFPSGNGKATSHVFSVPSGAVAAGTATLEVSVRGDYGSSTEYSNIYINNVFVGKHDGGGKECSSTYSTKTFTISQSDLAQYMATGQILVEVKNSSNVNICSNRNHKVTLTFDYTSGQSTACTFSISPAGEQIPASGGTVFVSINPSSGSCSWTTSNNISWVKLSPSSGTGSGSVTVQVAPHTGIGNRIGTVTIAGETFTINQAANTSATLPSLDTPVVNGTTVTHQQFQAAANDMGKQGDIYVFDSNGQYWDGSAWTSTASPYNANVVLNTMSINYDVTGLSKGTKIYVGYGVGLVQTETNMNNNGTFVLSYEVVAVTPTPNTNTPASISIISPVDNTPVSYGTSGSVPFMFTKVSGAAKYTLHLKLTEMLNLNATPIPIPIDLIPPSGGSSSTPGFSESALGMVYDLKLDAVTWNVLAMYNTLWGVEAYDSAGNLIGATKDSNGSADKYLNRLKFMSGNAIVMTDPKPGEVLAKSGSAPTFQWDLYPGSASYTVILAHVGSLGFDQVIQKDNLTFEPADHGHVHLAGDARRHLVLVGVWL